MSSLGIPGGQRRIGFHHGVMDLGAFVSFLAHQIGLGETGRGVAELVMNLPLDVVGFLFVQGHRAGLAGIGGFEIGGQLAYLEANKGNRQLCRGFVHRRHRRDRIADVAHLAARQRELVLGDRNHAVGHVAFIARNDGAHPRQAQRFGDVDLKQLGMGVRAAQDHADQGVGRRQIRRVTRRAGDFLIAVDERQAYADAPPLVRDTKLLKLAIGRVHAASGMPTAASTDSMIFT